MRKFLILLLIPGIIVYSDETTAETKINDFKTPGLVKKETFRISAYDAKDNSISAPEAAKFTANVLAFRDLIGNHPVAARPVGYNVRLSANLERFHVPYRPDLKTAFFPLMASVWFGAFIQDFDKNGKLEPISGETFHLVFWINRLPEGSNHVPWEWTGVHTDVVLKPLQYAEPLAGLPRVEDLLILKRNNNPLWLPVSVDETMKLMISLRKEKLAKIEKQAEQVRKNYTDYIDPAKRKERKQGYINAAKYSKDPQAFLAQMEEIEKSNEEIFRTQHDEANPQSWVDWANAIRELKEVEEDYAALSVAEKSANACYVKPPYPGDPSRRPSAIVMPVGKTECREVIRPNWKYFDPKLPRTAIQLVTVWVRDCPEMKPPANGNPYGCVANMKLLQTMDWNQIKAVMDQ